MHHPLRVARALPWWCCLVLRAAPAAGSRLNFAENITKGNTRWPRTQSWAHVCATRGAMEPQPADADGRGMQLPTTPAQREALARRLRRDL